MNKIYITNKYGEIRSIEIIDDNTLLTTGVCTYNNKESNGNAFDYRLVEYDGGPKFKLGQSVRVNGQRFKIDRIDDYNDGSSGDMIKFLLRGNFEN